MTALDIWVQPTTEQVVTALTEARYLLAIGWTQRQAHAVIDGRSCFCSMGAVAEVCGSIRLTHPVMWGKRVEIPGQIVPGAWLHAAVTAALVDALPSWPKWESVAAYNDARVRTREEILALFTVAIQIVLRKVVAA